MKRVQESLLPVSKTFHLDERDSSENGPLDARSTRRLFGRVLESATLADALARVRETGRSEIVLLSGVSGVGKSALVRRFRTLMAASLHSYTAGKSDQSGQAAPFEPVAEALDLLAHELLGGSDEDLENLRARLQPVLGGDSRLVIDLVPDMEIILGPAAARTEMPPALAKQRVQKALLATIGAFATRDAPLILFLDDIQWADSLSLELLVGLAGDPPPNILVVLAYRKEEVHRQLLLSGFLDAIRSQRTPITEIALEPLEVGPIIDMLETAFGATDSDIHALGHLIHTRTKGNPFFVQQVVRTLCDEGVIRYDEGLEAWLWNGETPDHAAQSGNVIDFTGSRVARLPTEQRNLLQSLALIGVRADPSLIAGVLKTDIDRVAALTEPLIENGFLHFDAGGIVFAHDRIKEVSAALTPEDRRGPIHCDIARVMVDVGSTAVGNEFAIAEQVLAAMAAPVPSVDRPAFAKALLLAGDRALQAAALEQAARFLANANKLSSETWWTTHYALAFRIAFKQAESLLQEGSIDAAVKEIDTLLAHAATSLDRGAAYRLKAISHTLRSDYDGAITAALSGLSLFGVDLDRFPTRTECDLAYTSVVSSLGNAPISSLVDLPKADDPEISETMSLLSTLISSIFAEGDLRFTHVAKIVELTLAHGVTAGSSYGLSWFGVFACDFYGHYAEGFEYGQAALAIIDRHGFETQRTGTLVAIDQISPWTQSFPYAVARVRDAISAGHAAGDLGMTCYARNHLISDLMLMGAPLSIVEDEAERGLQLTRRIRFRDIELLIEAQFGLARRLSANEPMRSFEAAGEIASGPTRFWVRLYAGIAAYLFGDFERASQLFSEAYPFSLTLPAHIDLTYFSLFSSLTAAQHVPRAEVLPQMEVHRSKFAAWAAINPRNFENKLLLIEAEMARLRGEDISALRLYDRAIDASSAFIHERAITHELAARHCHSIGLGATAAYHARAAHSGYVDWGALAKAATIRAAFPQCFDSQQGMAGRLSDVDTVLDLSLTFSKELAFDRLTEAVLRTMIERSGADRGLLMVMRDGEPVIEATGSTTGTSIGIALGAAIPTAERIPSDVLREVLRSQQSFVTVDDEKGHRLAVPLQHQEHFFGIVYLEGCASDSCTPSGVVLMERIATLACIALGTARRHTNLMEEDARRSQTQNALRAARAELARTSHLSVMGGLAASIAHEINQPLAGIVSNAGASIRWLKRSEPDIPEALSSLENIRSGGLRAAEIVRGLRALAKQQPASRELIVLNAVVRDVLELTAAEIDDRAVSLVVELDPMEGSVVGDQVQLQQVVLNLVTNAIDAMSSTPLVDRILTVTTLHQGDTATVQIYDRGSGVSPENLVRIFTPLFTTKANGMGMGLAICRSIIEAHGGTLSVRLADAKGTVFEFDLPIADDGIVATGDSPAG